MSTRHVLPLLLLATVCSLPPATAGAAGPASTPRSEAQRYDTCLRTARAKPQDGFDQAEEWRDAGGGAPAQHCLAIALVGLKQYGRAADLLRELARRLEKSERELSADLWSQAGSAELLGEHPVAARDALTEALRIQPKNVDYLIDHGRAQAALGRYWEAIDDFNNAVEIDRRRPEPLTYRAAAYRKLGSLDIAMEDVQHALQLAPSSPLALLERGDIQMGRGQKAAARADWLKVAMLAPGTPFQAAAQANIEKLDVNSAR